MAVFNVLIAGLAIICVAILLNNPVWLRVGTATTAIGAATMMLLLLFIEKAYGFMLLSYAITSFSVSVFLCGSVAERTGRTNLSRHAYRLAVIGAAIGAIILAFYALDMY